jgi:hypothetical protein
MKKLAVVLGVLLIVASASVLKQTSSLKPATFKIGQTKAWCTAFAISDTVAATAAHCVSDLDTTLRGQIDMYEANDQQVGVLDVEISKHPALDVALLKGNFKNRKHLSVSSDRFELEPKDEFDSCGFPMMGPKLVCSRVYPKSMYADPTVVGISGPGYLIFGMSGGPVFNLSTGHVVAVNTGLFEREIILSPFVNLEAYTAPAVPSLFEGLAPHSGSSIDNIPFIIEKSSPVQHLDMEKVIQ